MLTILDCCPPKGMNALNKSNCQNQYQFAINIKLNTISISAACLCFISYIVWLEIWYVQSCCNTTTINPKTL